MLRLALCSLVLLAAPRLAAQVVVVPAIHAAADAPSTTWLAGFGTKLRQQLLVDAQHLAPLVNRSVAAIAFRRDTGRAFAALPGGTATITIRLSTSPRTAREPSDRLADNTGTDELIVFSGAVAIPTAPAVIPSAAVPWTTPHAVRIPLTTPFVYRGGTLTIDLDGARSAGSASSGRSTPRASR